MNTVTLSPKFQVVIPRAIRTALGLKPGEKFRVIRLGERVEFIPLRKARELRGFLKGIDPVIEREGDRL
jgi:AbrB family looped-hinge helix DNA binding protein